MCVLYICKRNFNSVKPIRRIFDPVILVIQHPLKLAESKNQALRRLESLQRRFQRDMKLRESYSRFMDEYETSGHMTQISEAQLSQAEEVYFIPHHAVIKPDSLSTKLRVVFDASAKTTSGSSLNDKLLPGPNLQRDLLKLLIRFRIHQYVITADIAKMFRQVLVDPQDRRLQLILWRQGSEERPRIYQLNTVTYGTASAPYHAMRCLLELATQHQEEYPAAAKAIREDFYMDDVLSGERTYQGIIELQRQLFDLLKKGQFMLRKWRSNEPQALQQLQRQETDDLLVIDRDTTKTLGLMWGSSQDCLQYKVDLPKQGTLTKRVVLSRVSQIFDPLGLVGPILIRGKIFMQKLWAEDLQWDQPLPHRCLANWHDYWESLSELDTLQIPRNVNPKNGINQIDLFGFGDASQRALGACLYAVSVDEGNNTHSHLVCAKSRVAPLKTLSLPRLELEAALLLSQLYRSVRGALPGRVKQVRLWSDSTIVLGWIKTEPRALKAFVANRVAKIQELTEEASWGHVPSEENPAGILSRGTTIEVLKANELWWNGPSWIKEDDPRPRYTQEPELDLPERKIPVTFVSKSVTPRDKHMSTGKIKLRPLEVSELNRAERTVLKWVQEEEFKQELKCLMSDQDLPRKSLLVSLRPFIDKDGLIRVGGRLRHADISKEQRHPIILPKGHYITGLIAREEHEKSLHSSPEQLLCLLRQYYWSLRGRKLAQGTVKACYKCFRYRPVIPDTLMGDLPKERVTMVSRPFTTIGVDYAGPFQIRENRRRGRIHLNKGYVAVFVCFNTRAVHLEIVTSLTTEAFLAALSRFTGRRGICKQLFSDNGTNFVGAARELKELQEFLENTEPEIISFLAKQRINWSFIPPRAPHFGGLWEAAVKIMKRHLYTVTQGKILTFEEYITLITEIEAMLNSRPLTPLTNDPLDINVLTPAHFFIGDSLTQPVQHNYLDTPDNRLPNWQHLQKARQLLWQRWQREYLQELQKRSKWLTPGNDIKLNTLVLLIEDNVPPLRWPLGRVITVHPGADGHIRVVTVKTQTGCFKRAVRRTCPLPAQGND